MLVVQMNIENNRNVGIMIAVGFVLVMAGAVLPFLMAQQILKSTLFLNFFSFAISISGLFLGIIGGAMYVKNYRKNDKVR
jgi:ABC-type Mn2+/Zn2+ transport system permease subunit